jgi:hypothetical protein
MADRLKRPEAGEFVWRRLQYVFDTLDDPAAFAVAPKGLTDDELVVLARFVSQAERLAGTAFIAADDEVTINFGDDGEEDQILKRLSDEDVTAGHMVFLRQCYADHEEASFSKARKLVERGLHAAGETAALDQVKAWRKAHARIRNQTIEELVQERMVAEKLMPSDVVAPDGETHSAIIRAPASPAEMLRTFWYGDQIHWGKHREALAAVQADPFSAGMWEIHARQAAADLAYFYLGYAVVLERALAAAR